MTRADQRRVPSLAVYSKASDTWGRGRGHPCLAPKLVEQSQMQASRRVARLVLQNRSSSHDSRNKKLGTMIGKESRLGVWRSWNPHGKEVNVASLVSRKQEQRQQIQTQHRCPCPKGNGVLLPLLQQQQEGGMAMLMGWTERQKRFTRGCHQLGSMFFLSFGQKLRVFCTCSSYLAARPTASLAYGLFRPFLPLTWKNDLFPSKPGPECRANVSSQP